MIMPRVLTLTLIAMVFANSSAFANEVALELPAGKGGWVDVHFKASPESTPGKSLIAELLVTDPHGKMPIQAMQIVANPHFKDEEHPLVLPNGDISFNSQKGSMRVFVPAETDTLVLEAILFGVADRKLVLDYGISSAEVSDSALEKNYDQRIQSSGANQVETRRAHIPIQRVQSSQ